jgi:hypothetical protein
LVDVRGGESQDLKSRGDQQVLTAVVFDQSIPMISTVIFDDEPRDRVVQVSPANETTIGVVEILLHLWMRQTRLHEQPPEPRLHRRFRRLRQIVK